MRKIGRVLEQSEDSRSWWEETVGDEATVEEDGSITVDTEGSDDDNTPDVWEEVTSYVAYLADESKGRIDKYDVHHSIYKGYTLGTALGNSAIRHIAAGGIPEQQLNFTKNVVDAIHVKVSKNRPQVKAVVSDAEWSYINKAKKITRFLAAEFDRENVGQKVVKLCRQAEIDGTGIIKVYIDWEAESIRCDVVPPEELFVDEHEARYGEPRQMHQVKQYSRDELIGDFPEYEDEIMHAPGTRVGIHGNISDAEYDDSSEVIDVYESWKLPSRQFEDGEDCDGRHAVCIRGATLLIEEYRAPRFPFAVYRWTEPSTGRGFWGGGIVEQVQKIQWEIDKLVGQIQYSLKVGARTKIFVNRGSDINVSHIAHPGIGNIIEYGPGGGAPTVSAPEPVSQQLFSYLQTLIEHLYRTSGMSMDAASSQKPAGLNSGIALLHFHDFQTEHFIDQAKRLNDVYVDVGELMIDAARQLASVNGGYNTKWNDGDMVRGIDWSDVDMDADRFVLKLEAVSEVPDTHSGRLNLVTQLAQNGQIPESYITSLFENPDIPRMNRMLNADHNYAEWVIEQLLDETIEELPIVESAMNFELVIDMTRAAYLDLLTRNAPEVVIEKFVNYMDLVKLEVENLAPPTQEAPQAAPAPTAAQTGMMGAGVGQTLT